MDRVFQIWYETSVGPTFSSREGAEEYLKEQAERWGETYNGPEDGYPDIRELVLNDKSAMWDR